MKGQTFALFLTNCNGLKPLHLRENVKKVKIYKHYLISFKLDCTLGNGILLFKRYSEISKFLTPKKKNKKTHTRSFREGRVYLSLIIIDEETKGREKFI